MSKFTVCPTCEGEGFTSKLGAFTSDDLDEQFGDGAERDEFIEEYTTRGGIYDEHCAQCDGRRVVLSCSVSTCEKAREYLPSVWTKGEEAKHCYEHLSQDENDLIMMHQESLAEIAAGC